MAPRRFEPRCSSCYLRERCLPGGAGAEALAQVESMVSTRLRLKSGEPLYCAGEPFTCVYVIRTGFFKASVLDGAGREQITGFFMASDLLGMEAIGERRHEGTAVALTDSEVCAIPYSRLESMAQVFPALQRHLRSLLCREIKRDRGVMMLLGSMPAEARLATFLTDFSRRLASCGYSPSEMQLCMTRGEIGRYLGLQLATVSRLFSRFGREGLLAVDAKRVRILDLSRLAEIAGLTPQRPNAPAPGRGSEQGGKIRVYRGERATEARFDEACA